MAGRPGQGRAQRGAAGAGDAREAAAMSPRVIVVRGHQATPWELAPWERLRGEFDVALLQSRLNGWDLEGVALQAVQARTALDRLPRGLANRVGGLAGDRYRGLRE